MHVQQFSIYLSIDLASTRPETNKQRSDVWEDEGAATLTARADVALVAVEETVPDPHVRPRGRVAQLPLAHPTLWRRRDKQGSEGALWSIVSL